MCHKYLHLFSLKNISSFDFGNLLVYKNEKVLCGHFVVWIMKYVFQITSYSDQQPSSLLCPYWPYFSWPCNTLIYLNIDVSIWKKEGSRVRRNPGYLDDYHISKSGKQSWYDRFNIPTSFNMYSRVHAPTDLWIGIFWQWTYCSRRLNSELHVTAVHTFKITIKTEYCLSTCINIF